MLKYGSNLCEIKEVAFKHFRFQLCPGCALWLYTHYTTFYDALINILISSSIIGSRAAFSQFSNAIWDCCLCCDCQAQVSVVDFCVNIDVNLKQQKANIWVTCWRNWIHVCMVTCSCIVVSFWNINVTFWNNRNLSCHCRQTSCRKTMALDVIIFEQAMESCCSAQVSVPLMFVMIIVFMFMLAHEKVMKDLVCFVHHNSEV